MESYRLSCWQRGIQSHPITEDVPPVTICNLQLSVRINFGGFLVSHSG